MPKLEVRGLAVSRGDRTIFSQLDFSVASGEILHVQGRNGAGKTTLLETLVGLRSRSSGIIEGQPDASQRHWLGHRNALSAALTPVENLRFWCRLNGIGEQSLLPALERMGLKRVLDRPTAALSVGQRRRAAFARLLVAKRPWWFLDEPLSGIDPTGLALVAELLEEHAQSGGSAVVTSHQPLPPALSCVSKLQLGV